MAKSFVLSEEDRQYLINKLDDLIKDKVGSLRNPDRKVTQNQLRYSPEVYIAKPPAAGIPPLERADTVGTAVPGTGTGQYDRPGYANCDIHRILLDSEDIPEIRPVANLKARPVYNLSTSRLTSDWVPVHRTKYGKWIVKRDTTTIRLGEITAICDDTAGTGTNTSGDKYRVKLYLDSALEEATCEEETTVFKEEICCDIIDDDTGDFLDCQGFETTGYTGTGSGTAASYPNVRGDCVKTLDAPDIGATVGTGSDEEVITVQDLSGRQLPIGTVVAVTKVGELWIILEAGLDYEKVCHLTDIVCDTDCNGAPVLLRTFTPVWHPSWAVCEAQSEFVPECDPTGTGGGM